MQHNTALTCSIGLQYDMRQSDTTHNNTTWHSTTRKGCSVEHVSPRQQCIIIFGLCPNILILQRNLLFLARFCKTLSFYLINLKFWHNIPRVVRYTAMTQSRIFWFTLLLNGKRQFLLTCKVSRYCTMLLFKCKRQYLLTCQVSRYCILACTAVGL